MTKADLQEALLEAARFARKAEEALKRWHGDERHNYGEGKFNAAAKRASMDLTRALAKIRRSS